MNQIGTTLRALRLTTQTYVNGFVPSTGKMGRRDRVSHRSCLLNQATKKAIVIEMVPPELATHLRLDADRYNTYAHMDMAGTQLCQLEVAKPATTMWIDHAQQDEENDQEEWNIDYFGKTAKGKGKSKGKGKGKKGKGGD